MTLVACLGRAPRLPFPFPAPTKSSSGNKGEPSGEEGEEEGAAGGPSEKKHGGDVDEGDDAPTGGKGGELSDAGYWHGPSFPVGVVPLFSRNLSLRERRSRSTAAAEAASGREKRERDPREESAPTGEKLGGRE